MLRVPLVFVFPRVQKASLGLTDPSDCITKESFFKATIHFDKYVNPSIAGFQRTDIHPFNRITFTVDDILTSFVTDRPAVEVHNAEVSTDNVPFC